MKRKALLTFLIIGIMACSAGAVACKDDEPVTPEEAVSSSTPNDSSTQAQVIQLNAYDIAIEVGGSYELYVTNDGVYQPTWQTSDPAVATVVDGLVTGVDIGNAVITATVDGTDIEVRVSVQAKSGLTAAVNFQLSDDNATIYQGSEKQLATRLQAGDALVEDYMVVYESSNESVATVSESGKVTALALGQATITATATYDGKTYTDDITITVDTLSVLELSQPSVRLSKTGERASSKVSATVYSIESGDLVPDTDFAGTITYASSNSEVFTVDNSGTLTAVGAGEAILNVSTDEGLTASLSVTVHGYYAKIETAYDFLTIADHMDGYFELANDVDFTNVGFTPLGLGADNDPTAATQFTGYLNGNGYAVRNITHAKADNRSIFTVLGEAGGIENIAFENVSLPNSRASRSAGLVWSNYGAINNVRLTVTTNGEGVGVNDWGFGGVVSANRDTGKVTNCAIQLTANGGVSNLGAIFNVNQGGLISGTVALVNREDIKTHSHTGSFGTVSGATVTVNAETAAENAKKIGLSGLVWQVNASGIPVLKNAGVGIGSLSMERLIGNASAQVIASDATQVFYYDEGVKKYVDILTVGSDKTVAATFFSELSQGNNTIYMRTGSGNNEKLNVVTVTMITKMISTLEDLNSIINDMAGYYVLANNISLGRFNYPLGFNKTDKGSEGNNVPFTGTLDGKGYTLTYEYTWTADTGNHDRSLFYIIGDTGVVKNLGMTITTDAHNGVRRSAVAWRNKGTIENVYVDITYNNIGQGQNETFAAAGLVIGNYGVINNSIVNVTYTAATAIDGKLLGVCAVNNSGASITNTALIVNVQNVAAGELKYQAANNGTKVNTDPVYKSAAELYAAKDTFVANGFEEGDFWTITETGVTFAAKAD